MMTREEFLARLSHGAVERMTTKIMPNGNEVQERIPVILGIDLARSPDMTIRAERGADGVYRVLE